jgi:hypothetical protein
MRKISRWFKRRFKELDLLEEYFPLLFTRWQAAIWGGSVLAVAFGWRFIVSDWPPYIKETVCVVALFFAGYYVWRADHVRLQAKIEVTEVRRHTWDREGHEAVQYYFGIVNRSEALTIHGVRVQLRGITPEIENRDWFPIPLHLQHDNPLSGVLAQTFDLKPKYVDLLTGMNGAHYFNISHIVQGLNAAVQITGRHRLQVMITGADIPILLKWFAVWMDGDGTLRCEIE